MKHKERKQSAGTFLDIDVDNLDKELQKQAPLVKSWSDRLADAQLDMNEAKAKFELVKAELYLAISDKPELFGLEKSTVQAIEACVVTQEAYQKAQRRFNRKKHAVDVLKGTVEALDNKKKSLESEVDLFLSGYWADPRPKSRKSEKDFNKRVRKPLDDE